MSHTKTRKPYPRSFTDSQLAKVGVIIVNEYTRSLGCLDCQYIWSPMIQPGGKLPRGYWKCPQGCNE